MINYNELKKALNFTEYCNGLSELQIYEANKQLEKFIELASKQEPILVEDEDGITFTCPSCFSDNSKWIDWSMLQRQHKRAKRCQECGQLVEWEK